MNKVIMIGRLARETDLRFTTNGTAVANNAIAVEDGFGDKKKTYFFNVTVMGKFAETFAEWTFKGQQVAIEGKLQQNDYTNKEGQKVNKVDIFAEQVKFLERKRTPEFDAPKALDGELIELDDLPW
jgi:single-strand DNA-binding protein